MKKLTKKIVYDILKSRFQDGFLKLSSLPLPSSLKDIQKASKRVVKAIESKEKIVVIGDYDVDGVVSSDPAPNFV